ncbi:hypothetical protein PG996_007655 [Apiospora saccharicola]|uniref:Uncharacterized protein n=1 Tax=Apiospora saccharicola TaxID=335842 RepID=A0ABR1VBI4_9PEZI
MPNFLDLPRELRDQVYELCLVGEKLVQPRHAPWSAWARCVDHGLTTGLLRVSKSVYREASCVLYSRNIFDLRLTGNIAGFLQHIGCRNAAYIRHAIILFPEFDSLQLGHVSLEDGFADNLASIRIHCTHLHTITLYQWYTSQMQKEEDKPEVITEAMNLIDAQLRTIPSLRNIMTDGCSEGFLVTDGQLPRKKIPLEFIDDYNGDLYDSPYCPYDGGDWSYELSPQCGGYDYDG